MGATAGQYRINVDLPASAGQALQSGDVNFAANASDDAIDDDATCPDWPEAPPAGQVCLHLDDTTSDTAEAQGVGVGHDRSFVISWDDTADGDTARLGAYWSYTAP